MASWVALTADEIAFEGVSGVESKDGVIRYVLQRSEAGNFGAITVAGRTLQPTASLVYMQGNTVHVQLS